MKNIIVIDDNNSLVNELTAHMKEDSYFGEVYSAYEGKQALDLIRQVRPQIILTDIAMPNGEYRPVMMWFWNGNITEEGIEKELALFKSQNMTNDKNIHFSLE